MKTYLDCIPCVLRQSLEAVRNVTSDVRAQEEILREMLCLVSELELNRPPPLIGQLIHRKLRERTGVQDPYKPAKERFNRLVMDLLPELSARVASADDPLLAAAKIATVANAIDLGMSSNLRDVSVRSALIGACDEPLYGEWLGFRAAAKSAVRILYLADNCGEIVADRLLIEQLGANRVTLATRGVPVLNDATIDDARALGLECPVVAAHVGLPVGAHAVFRPDSRRCNTDQGCC